MRYPLGVVCLVAVLLLAAPTIFGCGGNGRPPSGPETGPARYGVNLISNSDAESGAPGDEVPNWIEVDAGFHVGLWKDELPYPASAPPNRGLNLFVGNGATIRQTKDVSSLAADIDARRVRYKLSGWLGSAGPNAGMTLQLYFLDGDDRILGTTRIGPVAITGRPGLLYRSESGRVPVMTRQVRIDLTARDWRYGYADNLALVFERA